MGEESGFVAFILMAWFTVAFVLSFKLTFNLRHAEDPPFLDYSGNLILLQLPLLQLVCSQVMLHNCCILL